MTIDPKSEGGIYTRMLTVDAGPARVWEAITEPALTRRYFFGTSFEGRLEAGAPYVYRTREGRVVLEGVIVEAVPGKRLCMTFSAEHDAEMRMEPRSRVIWEIEPRERGSALSFTHDELASASKTYRRALKDWPIVLDGLRRILELPFRSICVFGGASAGNDPAYAEAARSLGRFLAERGIAVVTGGSRLGIMGAVADGALAGGGAVTGIIPAKLRGRELVHPGLTDLVVVETMHERKAAMAARSDGFVALPGGWGTLEETLEAVSLTMLNFQTKPVGLLDVLGFFGPLTAFLDHVTAAGFIRPPHRRLLQVHTEPEALLRAMSSIEVPDLSRILDEADRAVSGAGPE